METVITQQLLRVTFYAPSDRLRFKSYVDWYRFGIETHQG